MTIKMALVDQKQYARFVLINGVFTDCEVDYYKGLSGKHPHGIHDSIWHKEWQDLGSRCYSLANATPNPITFRVWCLS